VRVIAPFIFVLMFLVSLCFAQKASTETITPKDVAKLQTDVKTINDKYEYIVKNFEIQNNTILYVSAVLGSLLALVIFYFGWKAQKVEVEYDRISRDKDKFREQYDNILAEFNNNLNPALKRSFPDSSAMF